MASNATPLHDVHARAGASFTEFGGWDMPLRYESDLAEHRAVRTSAGIFDLSHMGELRVEGPAAGRGLDYALTGPISKIPVGRARYTMIVNDQGGIIDDLIVYHLDEDVFFIVPNAGNRERVAALLHERLSAFVPDVTVTDCSQATALIAVQGPRAEEILRSVVTCGVAHEAALRPEEGTSDNCGADVLCGTTLLRRLRYYAAAQATAAGHEVIVARTGYTGEDGFELFCREADAVDLWEQIVGQAQLLPPTVTDNGEIPALTLCGLAARDSLRLEAGMPLYGHELTESMTPFDAGLGSVVALEKDDYVGREALLARADGSGQAGTQMLVSLVGQGRRAARSGCTISDAAGRPIGHVTSGLLSPTLGYPIALGLVDGQCGNLAQGEQVSVDVRGKLLPMRVVAAPFYKRAK